MKVIKFKEINSTNAYLKDNYKSLDNLTFVVAEHQTEGRGRLGRCWVDQDDLLFSILVKENIDKPTDYSLLIASTLLKVLNAYKPQIKWPNDIMINNKKVCGILLEGITKEKQECVIIGVGINVNTESFPEDLRIKATSLKNITNNKIDKEELLSEICKVFVNDYNDYIENKSDYLKQIRENFYLANKEISFIYNQKEFFGKVKGMDVFGNLLVETNDGLITLNSGEVTLNKEYEK